MCPRLTTAGSRNPQHAPHRKTYGKVLTVQGRLFTLPAGITHLFSFSMDKIYQALSSRGSSAENAVRNGGAGVYSQFAGGKEDKISLATGLYFTNYKAEAEALKTAAAHIEAWSTHASPNVVLLTDDLSVLQALQSNKDTELNDLSAALCRGHAVTLQWILSHCHVPGNEAADSSKGRHNKGASG